MAGDTPSSGPEAIDSSVPHSARIWNYWMGGKDNYPVDRAAGDRYAAMFPGIIDMALHSRYFLARVVRFLAAEAGIRQFLDIGSGLPTVDNTHEVAQRIAPESRIVYVDNDPLVLLHARALLVSRPSGTCEYIEADVHDPDTIVRKASRTLDFSRPIALMLMGVMGHVADTDEAYAIVRRLVDALPPGSYLVERDGTNTEAGIVDAQRMYNESGAVPYRLRGPEEIEPFFDGLELLEPGVVSCAYWRPDPEPFQPKEVTLFGGVARKQ
jgi:O-methyltransferase involved in polyketide biosynthesis